MNQDFDIYVLASHSNSELLKKFISKWAAGLMAPQEYTAFNEDGSLEDFSTLSNLILYLDSHPGSYSRLYWSAALGSKSQVDTASVFFNCDRSVVFGLGVKLKEISKHLKALVDELDVVAGFVTVGPPPETKELFLFVAHQSDTPKFLHGILVED